MWLNLRSGVLCFTWLQTLFGSPTLELELTSNRYSAGCNTVSIFGLHKQIRELHCARNDRATALLPFPPRHSPSSSTSSSTEDEDEDDEDHGMGSSSSSSSEDEDGGAEDQDMGTEIEESDKHETDENKNILSGRTMKKAQADIGKTDKKVRRPLFQPVHTYMTKSGHTHTCKPEFMHILLRQSFHLGTGRAWRNCRRLSSKNNFMD